MNIAITGSSGFLGKHLLMRLNKDQKLKVDLWNKKKMDLFNPETLKNFLQKKDTVVHLAGANKNESTKDIVKVNILGTKKLLEGISRYCPGARLIFASSFQVYDENVFGISKLVAEELIRDYVFYGLIKEALILRFSNIYGPGCLPFHNSVLSTFAYLIKNGKEIVINGNGKQSRDFLFIDDAVRAIEETINLDIKSSFEIFDVCSGRLISINQIVKILGRFSDKKVIIRYNEQNQETKVIGGMHKDAETLPSWQPSVALDEGLKKLMATYEN